MGGRSHIPHITTATVLVVTRGEQESMGETTVKESQIQAADTVKRALEKPSSTDGITRVYRSSLVLR